MGLSVLRIHVVVFGIQCADHFDGSGTYNIYNLMYIKYKILLKKKKSKKNICKNFFKTKPKFNI